MEQHHEKAQHWLASVYKDDPVPQYEINERTSMLLHSLYSRCSQSKNSSMLIQDDLNKKCLELSSEKKRIQTLLNRLGISSSEMSNNSQHVIRTLASAALALNLQDPSSTKFILGINKLAMDDMQVSTELLNQQRLTQGLLKKTNRSLQKLSHLKQCLVKAEDNAVSQQKVIEYEGQKIQFLRQKIKGYEKDLKHLQKVLSGSELAESLKHQNINKLSKEVHELNENFISCKTELDAYKSFPADIHLASLKLTEAKVEAEKLEAELINKIKNQ